MFNIIRFSKIACYPGRRPLSGVQGGGSPPARTLAWALGPRPGPFAPGLGPEPQALGPKAT